MGWNGMGGMREGEKESSRAGESPISGLIFLAASEASHETCSPFSRDQ